MIVEYSPDIKTQTFSEDSVLLRNIGIKTTPNGRVILGTINEPAAALDKYALEKMQNGQLISGLFSHPQIPNISLYDGTSNEWFKILDGTWPATIDTMTHLRGQKKSKTLSKAQKILDFACGNGMAGIYAVNQNPNIKEIDFLDINPGHILASVRNIQNYCDKSFFPNTFVSDGFSVTSPARYDVIIASAVPATPGYDGLKRPLNPLFEGTGLLERLLRDAPNFLNPKGRLILSHSSCGEETFVEYAKQYGAKVNEILDERDNAFRVEFLGDEKWVDHLVEKGGLIKKDTPNKYWHTVRVKEISYD